jgi:DNA-binding beta-propeller fold protein YncE
MRVHRLTKAALTTLAAVAAGWVLASPSALAVEALGLTGSFGGASSTQPDPDPLSGPTGVAVNLRTKDVYVLDEGNNRIEYFTPAGAYVGQFDGSAAPTGQISAPEGIAVDSDPSSPSLGDVYVLDTGHAVIDKFSSAGAYIGQLTGAASGSTFGVINGLAVVANGTVWIDQASGEIDEFDGAVANGFISSRQAQTRFGGETTRGFAVDSHDDLYVKDPFGVIAKLDSSGEVLDPELDSELSSAVAVDSSNDEVYVEHVTSVGIFSPGGAFIERFGFGPLAGGSGIAVDSTSGEVYVADREKNVVDVFGRGPATPAPRTDSPTDVAAVSATLNGDLNPGGVAGGVGFYFSYDIGASCTGPGSVTTPFDNGGANATGGSEVRESATVTELQPKTIYAFCFVADKFGSAPGPTMTFTTATAPPTVENEEAGRTTTTEAELSALVNPNNQDASRCQFQYVSAALYDANASNPYGAGVTAPCSPADLGSEYGRRPASALVTGLTAGGAYHFRVVVTNATGTSDGVDATFEAAPPLPPVIEGESAIVFAPPGATFEAQVNPELANTTYYFQYGPTTSYGAGSAPVPSETIPAASLRSEANSQVSTNVIGLAGSATYHYRVVAVNASGTTYGADQTFTTPPAAPAVSTGAVTALTQHSADLTGVVNPETLETSYYYQFGPTTEYGRSAPSSPGIAIGSGSSDRPAPLTLAQLTPGTTYHYRLVATSADGTGYGEDREFTTPAEQPPSVATGQASAVSSNAATISGTVDPRQASTAYRFEYGIDTSYGGKAFGTVSPQQGVQTILLSLAGLQPATVYHYRLVASNSGGVAAGGDQTFTTSAVLDPLVPPALAPLIAAPNIAFPNGERPASAKTLTNVQKLAKALKACRNGSRKRRARCERQARKKYASVKKKGKR